MIIYYVTSRIQKPNPNGNYRDTDQEKATYSPKWKEGGIALSSFLTLKSTNVKLERILKTISSNHYHCTYEENKAQEKFHEL